MTKEQEQAQKEFEIYFGAPGEKLYQEIDEWGKDTQKKTLALDELPNEYAGYKKHFDASPGKPKLHDLFVRKISALKKRGTPIARVICAGIGKFADKETVDEKIFGRESMHQLVVLDYLVDTLIEEKHSITLKDVIFQDPDIAGRVETKLLEHRGNTVVEDPAGQKMMTKDTFLFMPIISVEGASSFLGATAQPTSGG